ncbi:MAG: zinc-dependent metalloprotease [Planctomycetes bacterium]|nr:zinc-dependent metalloprotease [Planctomycetota bacterium]
MHLRRFVTGLALLAVTSLTVNQAVAQPPGGAPAASGSAPSGPPPRSQFETLTTGMKKADGLWTIYHKDQQILVEINPGQLNQNFLVLTSIAKGISAGQVLGGMTWGLGDDEVIWSFSKVGDKLHVIRRNVRFRANPGSPEASAVKLAYNDSVLYALPVITTTPSGGMLVDMTRIFLSDDENIGRSLGMAFAFDRSTVGKVKAFSKNVEIQVAAVYSGSRDLETVIDPRGAQVTVHYSISRLTNTDYRPRMADDRIGYFMTVLKDFSEKKDDQRFVRYINRWNLQKHDPSAKLSPPKEPIIFYMEKTVPINLRPYVRAGIEEWNRAFEKLGFSNAVEVRQQREEDDWDPEDVSFNTFRWITAGAGFAMGPSRVNPMTGQILDADIIFDADFLTTWKQQYETFTAADAAALMGQPLAEPAARKPVDPSMVAFGAAIQNGHHHEHGGACDFCMGMQQQLGFTMAVLTARGDVAAPGGLPDELIAQGLKEVVMHEVGHTLGLRHNFKASSWKTLAEIDDVARSNAEGTVASVMDYTPANIAPKGAKQGLYYPQTIGPYDYWVIEYGYKPIEGNEAAELKKIASRSAEPGHDYATDEDTRGGIDSDPLVNRFDFSKDPLEFARRQTKSSSELWGKVVERAVGEGDGYQRARQAFGMLMSEYWRTLSFVSRFPGGIYVHRDHKGDPNGRVPFKPVEAAKQRDAMKLLTESAFNLPPLPPPDVLNSLASTRWSHWGLRETRRLDYPVHGQIEMMQSNILTQLLSTTTLSRLHDSELKQNADADIYTLAEHLRSVVDGIFTEWREPPKPGEYNNRKPYISSLRRNLQRTTLKRLAGLVNSGGAGQLAALLGASSSGGIPEDARTLVRMHLTDLDKQITALLSAADVKLDDYTKAHLQDSQERIRKLLAAQVITDSID